MTCVVMTDTMRSAYIITWSEGRYLAQRRDSRETLTAETPKCSTFVFVRTTAQSRYV